MDISTAPNCSRNADSDMALHSTLGLAMAMVPEAAQTTETSMAPVAARPLATNMILSGCPDTRHHSYFKTMKINIFIILHIRTYIHIHLYIYMFSVSLCLCCKCTDVLGSQKVLAPLEPGLRVVVWPPEVGIGN